MTCQSDTPYLRFRGVTKWPTQACTIPLILFRNQIVGNWRKQKGRLDRRPCHQCDFLRKSLDSFLHSPQLKISFTHSHVLLPLLSAAISASAAVSATHLTTDSLHKAEVNYDLGGMSPCHNWSPNLTFWLYNMAMNNAYKMYKALVKQHMPEQRFLNMGNAVR